MKIYITGYASFEEWRDAGHPGAVSFNADGTRKDAPRTRLAKCRLCYHSMVRDGLCLSHFKAHSLRASA